MPKLGVRQRGSRARSAHCTEQDCDRPLPRPRVGLCSVWLRAWTTQRPAWPQEGALRGTATRLRLGSRSAGACEPQTQPRRNRHPAAAVASARGRNRRSSGLRRYVVVVVYAVS
eukprot:2970390-Alexandrium_andersonii.AAC.1